MKIIALTTILKSCALIYLILVAAEWWKSRNIARALLQLLPLAGLLLLDVLIASTAAGYVTFGPADSPSWIILLMFFAIALGIGARYIFYLRDTFSWLDLAKPLCIAPLLLLPLMASLQSLKELGTTQVVSFSLLAFQNGFFWQAVLQQARPTISRPRASKT